MTSQHLWPAVAVALCSAAVAQDAPSFAGLKAPTAEQKRTITALRNVLIDRLRDPESARFRREYLSRGEDHMPDVLAICGEFNSKNAMGGYGGFGRYIVTTSGIVMLEQRDGPSAFNTLMLVWCSRPVATPVS